MVASTPMMIQTSALRKVFRHGRDEVVAVAGLDLGVETGEIVGLLGPNGAGKSTTLRMLVTLLAPTSGEALVAGAHLTRDPATVRRRIGYVAQGGGTDPSVTGWDELVLQARLFGASKAEAAAAAEQVLDRFGLSGHARRPAGSLSGGQRRRLDLALGVIHRPRLLFLDEPTTGLDPQSRAQLWDEIRDLRWHGTTVVLTTHYLDEADALCDRVVIIDGGRVVAEGAPETLKRSVAGEVVSVVVDDTEAEEARKLLGTQRFVRQASVVDGEVRLYVEQAEAATPVVLRTLEQAGLEARSLSLHRPSLDDVFLHHTGRTLRDAA